MNNAAIIRAALIGVTLALFATSPNAALLTFTFSGQFDNSGALYNAGDTFSGSYTFETTAPVIDLTGDGDISTDMVSHAIDSGLPGTGWNLTVISSVVPGFSVSGVQGQISIGNNTSAFVTDRYVVTLFGNDALPGGAPDYFFQVDLIDSSGAGADIIDSGDLDAVPDLALAEYAGGRFVVPADNLGCTDCDITMTSLTLSTGPAPLPPECDIQMSQSLYVVGETVTANTFRIANQSSDSIATELKIWLGLPGNPPVAVTNLGADGSFELAPGMDVDFGPLPFLPVTTELPSGSYEFSCRMLNPITGELLREDRNYFEVQNQ